MATSETPDHANLVARIRAACPDLTIETIDWNDAGQFNHVAVVNRAIIFRFPRYADQARRLAHHANLLRQIREHLNLAIPNPIYLGLDSDLPGEAFIGYPIIPGVPLRRDTLSAASPQAVQTIVCQLATFPRLLHALPPPLATPDTVNLDGPDRWADLYARIQARLFRHMSPGARSDVSRHFESHPEDARSFDYEPVIRHGDFGTGNILFDPASESVRGVIDFDFAGLGDPATDLAVVLAPGGFGDRLAEQFRAHYPVTDAMLARCDFYRGTWALQEALHGIESGDLPAFERGIAPYR